MEGIEDGRAVDDCYHCVFVEPGARPCPNCHNRMRYVPASLTEPDERGQLVAKWKAGERGREVLERLWRLGLKPEDLV